jgi:fructose-1,6-bisphosphatase/inositol monophosphatase family enzyme
MAAMADRLQDAQRDELLQLAQHAAREAGALLLSRFHPADRGELAIATKSSSTDLVSDMDVAAERRIVEVISAVRPHDRFITEEGTAGEPARAGENAVTWVIDPLDGTINYLYGLPHWAVSIAVMQNQAVTVGVVHLPALGEHFCATRGGGASVVTHGREHQLVLDDTAAPELAQALISTGFSYSRRRRTEQADVVAQLLPQVRDVRRLGAAAADLCLVAAGRADGFYERALNVWDVAAGGLIAAEAGAQVTGIAGLDPPGPDQWLGTHGDLVVAAPAPLHRDLVLALRAADA